MARGKKKGYTPEIDFKGIDEKISISKVTAVKLNCDNSFFHLDKLSDGSWRLIYDSTMIPDISQLEGLEIVRSKN